MLFSLVKYIYSKITSAAAAACRRPEDQEAVACLFGSLRRELLMLLSARWVQAGQASEPLPLQKVLRRRRQRTPESFRGDQKEKKSRCFFMSAHKYISKYLFLLWLKKFHIKYILRFELKWFCVMMLSWLVFISIICWCNLFRYLFFQPPPPPTISVFYIIYIALFSNSFFFNNFYNY